MANGFKTYEDINTAIDLLKRMAKAPAATLRIEDHTSRETEILSTCVQLGLCMMEHHTKHMGSPAFTNYRILRKGEDYIK